MEKPPWLKVRYSPASQGMKELIQKYNLHSVCQSAHCPNCSECWSAGTATFMVLGDQCTRNCRFCSVKTMQQNRKPDLLKRSFNGPLVASADQLETGNANLPDPKEPGNLASAVKELKLKYVVLTSVDRDDLPDFGAGHFAECIRKLKTGNRKLIVEALVPDFNGNKKSLKTIVASGADVLGHNLETVERLTPKVRDRRASYKQSLEVLRAFKTLNRKQETGNPKLVTKSSLMLGLGEIWDEVIAAMKDLCKSEVDILTLGQYLRPTEKQLPVERYIPPEEFKEFEKIGKEIGFRAILAGPFVRSSYKAAEVYGSL